MSVGAPSQDVHRVPTAWLRPRWVRAALTLAALLLIAGLAAPYFLNADRLRVTLSDIIAEQTGRSVMLGKMRVRLLPRVGFAVEGFRMGNPASFAAGEFLSAKQVRGSLAFWPLILRKEYRITSLELIKPKLALLEDRNGRNNYTFEPRVSSSAAQLASIAFKSDANATTPEAGGSQFQVDELMLRDAAVIYGSFDGSGHTIPFVDVSGFSAVLMHLMLQPLQIGEWQAAARLGGARLMLAGWNGVITFRDGDVALHGSAIQSNFTADCGPAALVEGTLSVPDVEHAAVKVSLKTEDLDLTALTAGVQAAGQHAVVASDERLAAVTVRAVAGSDTSSADRAKTAPATDANDLLAEAHLDAERIRSAPYQTGPATADLRLYPDRLEIWPVTIRLYGGSLQLSARTDRRQTPQRFSTNMEARNLNLGQLVDASAAARGKFAGTGELDLQLFGSLDATWKKSLGGHGEFAIRNGRIRGLNLTGAAESLAKLVGISGDTTFVAIAGDINLQNQRIVSRDIRLNSSRNTADLAGSLGFDGSLDFDGQLIAQLDAAQFSAGAEAGSSLGRAPGGSTPRNGTALTLPFALRGTLAQPELGPGHTLLKFPPANQPNQQTCCSFPNLFHK